MYIIPTVPCGYQNEFNKDYYYDFILLHKILDNEKYRSYYQDRDKKHAQYVILDNSCFELRGKGIDEDILMKWAYLLHVNEIILPDVFRNPRETIKVIDKFLFNHGVVHIDFKFQVVPQGKDYKERMQCLDTLLEYNEIGCIGLNKLWSIPEIVVACQKIKEKNKEIHKLGTNFSFGEWYKLPQTVRSADSRILTKLVTGQEDIWEEKLDNKQCNILHNIISELNVDFDIFKKTYDRKKYKEILVA